MYDPGLEVGLGKGLFGVFSVPSFCFSRVGLLSGLLKMYTE